MERSHANLGRNLGIGTTPLAHDIDSEIAKKRGYIQAWYELGPVRGSRFGRAFEKVKLNMRLKKKA